MGKQFRWIHQEPQYCGLYLAIIWTKAGILLIGSLGKKLQWNLNRNSYILSQENTFENVIWKMAAIFLNLSVLT